jgi:hypothetical protein
MNISAVGHDTSCCVSSNDNSSIHTGTGRSLRVSWDVVRVVVT